MVEAAIQALAASGPLAILMGLVIVVLWKENRALRSKYEGDPGDAKTPATKGRIQEMIESAQAREDGLRANYEQQLKEERDAFRSDLKALNETLEGYTEE